MTISGGQKNGKICRICDRFIFKKECKRSDNETGAFTFYQNISLTQYM